MATRLIVITKLILSIFCLLVCLFVCFFSVCVCFISQFSCGQGGCGACTVNIRPWPKSPTDPPAKFVAANGCLRPLAAVHEMDVSRQSAWKHHLYLVMTVPTILFMSNILLGPYSGGPGQLHLYPQESGSHSREDCHVQWVPMWVSFATGTEKGGSLSDSTAQHCLS